MLWWDMHVVGLTGGLASGKSTIAQVFQQHGARIIDADQLTRIVVQPKRAAWKDIVNTFGRSVLTEQGTVNRKTLAHAVFGKPKALKTLTRILYPRVAKEQARLTRHMYEEQPDSVIIYDAAMLIESGAYKRMDEIIVVKTNQRTQIRRAVQRTDMSQAEAKRRLQHQLPLRVKISFADYVIDGTLPISHLRPIVRDLYMQFVRKAQR